MRSAISAGPLRRSINGHINFRGPDEERLVQGRERIYLDRFYNELSADPKAIDAETRDHCAALYAKPHAMHDAFEQFGAFSQDATDNKALLRIRRRQSRSSRSFRPDENAHRRTSPWRRRAAARAPKTPYMPYTCDARRVGDPDAFGGTVRILNTWRLEE